MNDAESNKLLITTLVSVLVTTLTTITGSWIFWGKNSVTQKQLSDSLETRSPYLRDKKFVIESLEQNSKNISALTKQVNRLLILQERIIGKEENHTKEIGKIDDLINTQRQLVDNVLSLVNKKT